MSGSIPIQAEPGPDADSAEPCASCLGTGYVCENHPDRPWDGITGPNLSACGCGAGMPCPECCAPTEQDGCGDITTAFVSTKGTDDD